MKTLLPPSVAVAEAFGDPPEAVLLPAETEAIARAVDKRRREYTTVRYCARLALGELGLPPTAILNGSKREPLWPAGIVGALTHCDGYRAAAVVRASEAVTSLGIDAEPHLALPDGVLDTITNPEELSHLASLTRQEPTIHWDRLLFSAKESVYKAWFPVARCWLGFEDATLRFDPSDGTFAAQLHVIGPVIGAAPLTAMRGRWRVHNGLALTAVVVPVS
ncbi:4'-phosphopantetheinyl transferase EntD [Catenulispora sp. EB89]|uniref:4'-phosphopantetheinyl transferase family protein n=1 Tax=Catenulispora sp. EB89 TaxID=3156257 RepID=UPI003518E85C